MSYSRTRVYTPPYIAEYLVEQTLGRYLAGKTVGQIQSLRCLEPACGDGVFLVALFERLADFYEQEALRISQALDILPLNSPQRQSLEAELVLTAAYPTLILKQHLFGIDLDPLAVEQAKASLLARAETRYTCSHNRIPSYNTGEVKPNIVPGNFLLDPAKIGAVAFENPAKDIAKLEALHPLDWEKAFPAVYAEGGFDVIVGNPPYLGFNDYAGAEKAYFQRWYPQVYNLKNDLLYYFFYRPAEMLKKGGKLGYIVSRFWKEAAFASRLRGWLAQNTTLEQLIDLAKLQAFENAAIDTCLLTLNFSPPPPNHHFEYVYFGQPHTDFAQDTAIIRTGLENKQAWLSIPQGNLDAKAWKIHPPTKNDLISKLRAGSIELGEICECKTGVQTGYDRAFLPDNPQVLEGVEPEVLKPALKNSHISPYKLAESSLRLVYPPRAIEPEKFPGLLGYLAPFRAELEKRNRYRKTGAFPYYELQWAREQALFEAETKLVCPYKAPFNTFALDAKRHYFSTDVIAVVPKQNCPYSPLALLALLNSKLATFYFRSYGKPMGGGQYDYYANPVKKLPVLRPLSVALPDCEAVNLQLLEELLQKQSWDELKDKLIALSAGFSLDSLLSWAAKKAKHYAETAGIFQPLLHVIDAVIYRLYDLTADEINLIETYSHP
jgi:TaqI-like C-terminal specificity domain/Eco57I restriction-modification methylase